MCAGSTADAAGAPGTPRRRAGATIVVGLGNPILGDDGAGWAVSRLVEARLAGESAVTVERLAVGGLTLMERLVGYRRAIVVDALVTGTEPPGTVRLLGLDDLPAGDPGHTDSAHDASLAVALEAGRRLGATLPAHVHLVTIEAARVHEVREDLTPAVEAAVPRAADLVLGILGA